MAEKVKIKTKHGTISATPEQAEAFKAREEQDKIQKERIAAVRENARTMNRYRQQTQTYKQQSKAREERAAGGYNATPTNRYGKPIESFWAKEPPAMPEMRPVPALPEVPQLPTGSSSKLMSKGGPLYEALREAYSSKYTIPLIQTRSGSQVGPYTQNPAPSFLEFGGFENEYYTRGVREGGVRNYNPDYGLPYPFNARAWSDWRENRVWSEIPSIPRMDWYRPPYTLPYGMANPVY
jgi:hypothetical protein